MRSALLDLGAASLEAFWLPVLAWTLLALLAEASLRVVKPSARIGLATRGSLVALLPLSIVGPPLLARWVPSIRPAETLAPLAPSAQAPDALAALPSVSPEAVGASLDWTTLAVGGVTASVLLAGALALVVLVGGLVWIARYRQRLRAASRPVRDEAIGLSRQMGVRRRVQIAVVDDAVSPFTVGLWRPLVALPEDLAPEARRLALAHEIAHVRDAHFGWAVGEQFVRAAFVWHPLVHVLGRGLALDREREADAAVLRLWPERAAEYGQLLHALSSRPSPRFSLGASTSPLLSRLHAMTRSTPERRRLARLMGAMLLVLPLLASAAVLPDAPLQTFASQPEALAPPPAPEPEPLAPEAAPEAPEALDGTEVLPTPPTPSPHSISRDTLVQYITNRSVRDQNGVISIQLNLNTRATYEIAEAIANYYSDGDEQGSLVVYGRGFQIRRGSLREGAMPPAPPPPPPSAPEAPPPPPTPPAVSDFIQLGGLAVAMSGEELERYTAVLRTELRATSEQLEALNGQSDFESREKRMRLEIRLRETQGQYEQVIQGQERRRLEALRDSALADR